MDPVTRWALNWCISNRVPFCAFREPGKDKMEFYSAPSLLNDKDTVAQGDRFFIGEFNKPFDESYFIPLELNAQQTLDARPYGPKHGGRRLVATNTDHDKYTSALKKLIDNLKIRGKAKTVISRVAVAEEKINAMEAFLSLLKNHSADLFCSCCYHPKGGWWLGATPELMLDGNVVDGSFRTLALAGTKTTGEDWDAKNKEEQQIVSDYVAKCLDNAGAEYDKGETHDLEFGSLQHLATEFGGITRKSSLIQLIDSLNPTPALCGYPKSQALEDIAQIETQPRGCYGGIIGVQRGHNIKAYVNIRCVNFGPTRYAIRAGGGILADSDPEAEWIEAERKIQSLRQLLMI